MHHSKSKSIITFLGLAAAACGGGSGDATPDGPVGPFPDATAPGDAAPPAPTFVSNPPGAKLVDAGTPATPNLVVLSSNVLQQPSGGQVFQQWFAEIKNAGTTTVCQIEVNATFKTAGGTPVVTWRAFVDGPPWTLGTSALTMGCLAPGEIGSIYDNAFAPMSAALDTVATIAVGLTPQVYPDAIRAAHAPALTSRVMQVFGSFYAVAGTLTGQGGAIYNIGIASYPRDARGLVFDQLVKADLDTLAVGARFDFTSTSSETLFTDYRTFIDYIDGAKPLAPLTDRERAAAAIEETRRAQRDAIQGRRPR